jgi:hypothetical protein
MLSGTYETGVINKTCFKLILQHNYLVQLKMDVKTREINGFCTPIYPDKINGQARFCNIGPRSQLTCTMS